MTLVSNQTQQHVSQNEKIVMQVLQELIRCGVKEICVCPGGRNTPFVTALHKTQWLKQYFWSEERSAAFFALGRSKLMQRPTVVLTTSGTAAGELLPAAMEAYYTGVPLILLTVDRPRHFRGTGSPQTAEQVGLYGQYAVFEQDLAKNEECILTEWKQNGAVHLNICLDEPLTQTFDDVMELKDSIDMKREQKSNDASMESATMALDDFLQKSRYPFVVVSAIHNKDRESIVQFLKKYNAPVYLEGVSGLREDPRLSHLRIVRTDNIWKAAAEAAYPIDGILRIGAVPTFRLWRDLENREGQVHVCSISSLPFSGLSWGTVHPIQLDYFFEHYSLRYSINEACHSWIHADRSYVNILVELFQEEPLSEAALVHELSKQIPHQSQVYLGNSLPIREWDTYATSNIEHSNVFANRGLNGIDGQLSTFFGMCQQDVQNWGMIGDLTTIYDLAGPWILDQMQDISLNLVIINNGGGKIFARMFPLKQIQNSHRIRFKSLAVLWNMHYEYYTQLPKKISYGGHRLIEIVPDEEATIRFWNLVGDL